MFEVKAGTKVLVIKDGVEWFGYNFKDWTTKQDNLFEKEEMVIDPTGIATWTPPLSGVTIGSAYAKAGWYGFKSHGYIVLVGGHNVRYIG